MGVGGRGKARQPKWGWPGRGKGPGELDGQDGAAQGGLEPWEMKSRRGSIQTDDPRPGWSSGRFDNEGRLQGVDDALRVVVSPCWSPKDEGRRATSVHNG